MLILAVVLSALLASCVTHYFSQPLPVDATTVNVLPKDIHGSWISGEEEVVIDKTSWTLNSVDSTGNKKSKLEFAIPDSLVVKKWRNYHFFNIAETDGYWTLYLGYKHKNFYYIKGLGDKDTLKFREVLKIQPQRINKTQRFYNSPITKKQLRKLFRNGGFCDTVMMFDLKKRVLVK